jgi:hypothetical protein
MDRKNSELNKEIIKTINNTIDNKLNDLEIKITNNYQSNIKLHGDENTKIITDMIKLLGLSMGANSNLQIGANYGNHQQLNNDNPTECKRMKNNEFYMQEDAEMDKENYSSIDNHKSNQFNNMIIA